MPGRYNRHNAARWCEAARVGPEFVAGMDVIVYQRGEQIVRLCDCAEVAGEMEIDVLHRHHLRETAAGSAALDAKHRPHRGLSQTDDGFLAQAVQCITQPHRRCGFPLTRRRR